MLTAIEGRAQSVDLRLAGLEALLALRALAGDRVEITVVAPRPGVL